MRHGDGDYSENVWRVFVCFALLVCLFAVVVVVVRERERILLKCSNTKNISMPGL